MTAMHRWTVTCLVVVAALLLGGSWAQRIGLFALTMALVITWDTAGDDT